jgi:hypothetical protein
LIPNGINGREFAHFNPGHKIPGTAVFSGNLLNYLVEKRPFGAAGGFVEHALVKFTPALPVNVQAGRAVFIPPWLGAARDVRVSCVLLKG